MKPDGSGERILTEGFHNEGPTFAPNGRVIMFFRDPGGNGGPALFTVDITGRNEQQRSDARLRVRSGLVAAAVVNGAGHGRTPCATAATRSRLINHAERFRSRRYFSLTGQRLIKVDGTFA